VVVSSLLLLTAASVLILFKVSPLVGFGND